MACLAPLSISALFLILPFTLLLQGKGSLPTKGRVAAEQRCRAKGEGRDSQG